MISSLGSENSHHFGGKFHDNTYNEQYLVFFFPGRQGLSIG